METICDCLAYVHRHCDDLFSQVEISVTRKEWAQAEEKFQQFDHALKRHLEMEETILFPVFKRTMHNSAVPIGMLQLDHQHIRMMAGRLYESLCRCDPVDFMIHTETFTILMQEHSIKEEDMLYPLLDRILSGNIGEIVHAMHEAIETTIPIH